MINSLPGDNCPQSSYPQNPGWDFSSACGTSWWKIEWPCSASERDNQQQFGSSCADIERNNCLWAANGDKLLSGNHWHVSQQKISSTLFNYQAIGQGKVSNSQSMPFPPTHFLIFLFSANLLFVSLLWFNTATTNGTGKDFDFMEQTRSANSWWESSIRSQDLAFLQTLSHFYTLVYTNRETAAETFG